MRGCVTFLSIIGWMCLVVTALFRGMVSAEVAVWALLIGIVVFAAGGRRIMASVMPIVGLLILLYVAAQGIRHVFVAAVQMLMPLAVMSIALYIIFSAFRRRFD